MEHQNGVGNVAEEIIKDCTSDEVTSDEVALPIQRAMETTGMRSYNLGFFSSLLLRIFRL